MRGASASIRRPTRPGATAARGRTPPANLDHPPPEPRCPARADPRGELRQLLDRDRDQKDRAHPDLRRVRRRHRPQSHGHAVRRRRVPPAGSPSTMGNASTSEAPAVPRSCVKSGSSMDDYANNGIVADQTTSNVLLQDIYTHGLVAGPLRSHWRADHDGPRRRVVQRLRRVGLRQRRHAQRPRRWSIDASAITDEGRRMQRGVPHRRRVSLARHVASFDSDARRQTWSGQTCSSGSCALDSFTCDHCVMAYNTKRKGWIHRPPCPDHRPEDSPTPMSYGNAGRAVEVGNLGQLDDRLWSRTPSLSATARASTPPCPEHRAATTRT